MYEHILIPVEISHEDVVPEKLRIARRLLSEGGRITLLSAVESAPSYVAEYVMVKPAGEILDDVRARVETLAQGESGVECVVLPGKPGIVAADFAAQNAVDLIVVGAHRPGVQDYYLGATASRIVRRAGCSVFVLR